MLTLALRMLVRRRGLGLFSLNECWLGIHRCLICLPVSGLDEQSLQMIIDRLRTRFPLIDIIVVSPTDYTGEIPDGVERHLLRREDFSFFGIPSRALKEKLRNLNIEMAVDLSPRYNPLTAFCCELSGAKLKVGFAWSDGEQVFNYQVSPNPATTGIERYRVLANYIG